LRIEQLFGRHGGSQPRCYRSSHHDYVLNCESHAANGGTTNKKGSHPLIFDWIYCFAPIPKPV